MKMGSIFCHLRHLRILLLWVVLWGVPVLADKEYHISRVEIDGQLYSNGSLAVIEARTYQFKGSFRYAYRTFPKNGPVTFHGFQVEEADRKYLQADTEENGTFTIIEEDNETQVRWFYRARNQSRTFIIKYVAENAVKRHPDAAVLYYQFISADWDRRQQDISLRLKPPLPMTHDAVSEWLHGPLWAESRIESDGTITAWCERLPRKTFFEIRALYPAELFPEIPLQAVNIKEAIMKEEANWAEQANLMREKAILKEQIKQQRIRQSKWVAIVLSLAGLAAWYRLYQRRGQHASLPPEQNYVATIPQELTPALATFLLSRSSISGNTIIATLMDLARRHFLSLKEEVIQKKSLFGKSQEKIDYVWHLERDYWENNAATLYPYEKDLIHFFFYDLAQGSERISLHEIERSQNKVMKFFQEWYKTVRSEGAQRNWFDREGDRASKQSLLLSGALLLVTIVIAILPSPWALLSGAAALVVFILSFLLPHRTREGEYLARQVQGLKRYLGKFEFRKQSSRDFLQNIDQHLIYGVAFGISRKAFQELAGLIPADQHATFIPWYAQGDRDSTFSAATFSDAFSAMIHTTTSAMSTSTGTGGGASGGGGGGASSGGGGAG